MRQRLPHFIVDGGYRAAGIGTVALGMLAVRVLGELVRATPAHAVSATELALSVAGFLCLSGGALLALLGAHVTDQVRISSRWHSTRRPARDRRAMPIAADRVAPPPGAPATSRALATVER